MKMTYAELRHRSILPGISKLASFNGFSTREGYNVAKIYGRVMEEFKLMAKLEIDLLKQYCQLDEKGNVVAGPSGHFLPLEGTKAEFEPKWEEFLKNEVEIDRPKIQLQALQNAQLSPLELEALEPLINGLQLEAVKS